nr:hypothetical protein [Tanacetum cinerariifolium]
RFIKYSNGQIPPKKSRGKGSQRKKAADDSQKTVDLFEESEPEPVKRTTAKQESKYSEEDQLDDEEKDDKEGDADDETESDEDDIYKYNIYVRKDEDEEMLNVKVEDYGKGDAEMSDMTKEDAEKTKEAKDDSQKAKLPPTSSILSVSSEDAEKTKEAKDDSQKAKLPPTSSILSVSSEPTFITPVQATSSVAPVTTLPLPSVFTTPPAPQHTTTPIPTPPITTDALTITTVVPESDALSVVQLRVAKLERMYNYLGSKVGDVFQKELKKHTAVLIQKYSLQQFPELPKNQTPTVDLEQEFKKSHSKILKIKKEQAEKQKMLKFTIKNPANHRLYHALMEALIEDENAMDKGVADTVKDHKRKHDDEDDDDEDPPAGPNQEPTFITPVQATSSAAPVTTLPLPSIFTTPPAPQHTTTPIPTPPITTDAPTITTVVPESDALSVVQLRELKKHTAVLIQKYSLQQFPELPKNQTPTVDLEQEFKKSPSNILKIKKEQAEKQKMLKFTIKNPTNHRLYYALMEDLIEDENAMDKGVADTVKDHKRKHDDEDDDDEDPPAGGLVPFFCFSSSWFLSFRRFFGTTTKETSKGKALSTGSKTGKSASAKEPIEEPTADVAMVDAGEDVVHDDDQPQDTYEPKTAKTPNPEWFTQPTRPPTPDPK